MTFDPVFPPALLAAVALALIALRLITMYQLHTAAGARWATVWRWCGLTLAVMLLMIAAMRPSLATGGQQAAASPPADDNINVFLVVDRSPDSGVSDFAASTRMAGIRADIAGLLDRYPHARFALIAFSSRASLDWPLSEDVWSLRPVTARLTPYDEPEGRSTADAGAAANVLRYQLIAAGQQYRDSANLVFYFGSGASGSSAPQAEFEPVAGTVDGGAVLGYGTPPEFDQARLELIAGQLGIAYVHREPGQPLPEAVVKPKLGAAQHEMTSIGSSPTELYWVFTFPAAVLLLFELFLTVREIRRTRTRYRGAAV
ncbi:VWA domain-containing protein [Mycobacterium sp. NPDC048908]|uniref:VWA domain-containing protein n=1 Tax=Mycobacterium sp. NPDC048908 TaxID=3364292 RepID=UPI00371BDABB